MASPEFDAAWADLRREPATLSDPHAAARRLVRDLRTLDEERQFAFVEALMPVLLQQHRHYGIVLFLLEGVIDEAALHVLARHLLPLAAVQEDDDEAHLADLIRILAAVDDPELLAPVEHYLLEREIGPQWSTTPWALWPHRRRLFARAWERYFTEQEPSAWHNTLVVKSFLTEPDAIRVVRRRLVAAASERWDALRDALLRQGGSASWLSEHQRTDLERSLQ